MPNHPTGLPEILYVATTNPGKLRDFASAAGPQIVLLPLPGLADIPEPVEDASTFEGNARLKAIAYSLHAPGQIVLADDSGLEVDALGGAPGVRSARFADDHHFPALQGSSRDDRNNACLLDALAHPPASNRRGRYRCSLAAACDGQILAIASGSVEGELLEAPRGTSGFGYDPLFLVQQHGLTMAELDPATRLACSHRGNALRALLPLLGLEPMPK